MNDSVSEPVKVTVTVSVAFQDLNFAVASLSETVCIHAVKRIKYSIEAAIV